MGIFASKYSQFESELPDVSGKVFVITGTTSGTGFAAAECVAKHKGEVLLLNRPSERSVASLAKLKASVPDGKFVAIDCDLQCFDSVSKASKEIKQKYSKLYCLSNNAGIMATPDEITGDGYEKQMQTNHLSHFLLTKELFPLLVESAKDCGDARLVQHSSMARDMCKGDQMLEENYLSKQEKDGQLGGDLDKAGFMKGPQWDRYAQTKLANSVFAQALTDRIAASKDANVQKVNSLCAHPGIADTNLGAHLSFGKVADAIFGVVSKMIVQTKEDGAMGLLKAMMDKPDNVETGMLYGPKGMTGYAVPVPPKAHESDVKSKNMLWKASESATGVTFAI